MQKEGKKNSSNRKIIFTTVLTLAILIAAVIFFTGLANFYKNSPSAPLLGPRSIVECGDGLDNDNDGGIDVTGSPRDYECSDEAGIDECIPLQTLFRISHTGNAHGAEPYRPGYSTQPDYYDSNYPYSVCWNAYFASGNVDRECTGSNEIIRLVNNPENENMHAEEGGQTNSNYKDICLGDLKCQYATDCSTLDPAGSCYNADTGGYDGEYKCLASFAPIDPLDSKTNLHVGRCEAYPTSDKLCCCDSPPQSLKSPGGGSLPSDPETGNKLVMQGDTFSIGGNQQVAQSLLGSGYPLTAWALTKSVNEGPFTAVTSGGSTVPPTLASIDTTSFSVGTLLKFKLTVSSGYMPAPTPTQKEVTDGTTTSVKGTAGDTGATETTGPMFSPPKTVERLTGTIEIILPIACGDGTKNGNETCDWSDPLHNSTNCSVGGYVGIRYCNASCSGYGSCITTGRCGDGTVQSPPLGPEGCDDGNNITENCLYGQTSCTVCDSTCQYGPGITAYCGDTIIQSPPEQCDPQGSTSTEGCTGQYTYKTCNNSCAWGPCQDHTPPCFLPGTKVLIPNNKEQSIEQIKVGDFVLSYNEKTNSLTQSKVLQTFEHDSDGYYIINGKIKVTGVHPIWVSGKWKQASELKISDKLMTKDKTNLPVYSISYVDEKTKVYNLEVENTENYFAEGILVHNKPPCFAGDTQIRTPEGSVAIKDLKIGDVVLSYNEQTKELETTKVTETTEHLTDNYLIINKNLKVTSNHRMLINGKWQEIGQAKIGDSLIGSNSQSKPISSIENVNEEIKVYNIEVENNHNYLVNDMDVVVHNAGSGGGVIIKKDIIIEPKLLTPGTPGDVSQVDVSEAASGSVRMSPGSDPVDNAIKWFLGLF
jgi:hypothetical protein